MFLGLSVTLSAVIGGVGKVKVKVNDEKQTKRSFKIGDKWKISYVHDNLFIDHID